MNFVCYKVKFSLLFAMVALWLLAVDAPAQNQDADERVRALEDRINLIQKELEALRQAEGNNPDSDDDPFGNVLRKKTGINFHFYGEAKYNVTHGSKGNYFDPHRFVLIPSYKVNDWIFFNCTDHCSCTKCFFCS